jgi:hypothetical protein
MLFFTAGNSVAETRIGTVEHVLPTPVVGFVPEN